MKDDKTTYYTKRRERMVVKKVTHVTDVTKR